MKSLALSFIVLTIACNENVNQHTEGADCSIGDQCAMQAACDHSGVDCALAIANDASSTEPITSRQDVGFNGPDQTNISDMSTDTVDAQNADTHTDGTAQPCYRCLALEPYFLQCPEADVMRTTDGESRCVSGNNDVDCASIEQCCAQHRRLVDTSEMCGDCLPNFTGENCQNCSSDRFVGERCDECADPQTFTGPNCESCVDRRFAGPDCTTCSADFAGVDCEIEFVQMEGGTFDMGGLAAVESERPIRAVTVETFRISTTEITVKQYRACVEAGACTPSSDQWSFIYPGIPSEHENFPVSLVTWNDAKQFASFVQARLPTEAEWEYAARAGGLSQLYPWGNEPPDACSNVNYNNCQGNAIAVCSYPSGNTAQGLCDMAGNLWEWVEDDWHENYEGAPADGGPWFELGNRTSQRVIRGGGWFYPGEDEPSLEQDDVRVSARVAYPYEQRAEIIGFRLVRYARD